MEQEWCILVNTNTLKNEDLYSFHYELYDNFIANPPYKDWKLFKRNLNSYKEAVEIIEMLEQFLDYLR